MKILFLSYYYPPDLSAGSFRAQALVEALLAADPALEIDLVTTEPNRYAAHRPEGMQAGDPRLRITRVPVGAHRSGMLDQALGYRPFVTAARKAAAQGGYDLVYATSSRLMTAVLGAALAPRGVPLYLDIRDIFTETIGDVLKGPKQAVLMPFLRRLEAFAIRKAARVNLVSQAFEPHFRAVDDADKYRHFTNGIDPLFLAPPPPPPARAVPRILYAGNLGEGQGLERVLPEAARKLAARAEFRIIGGGGRRDALARGVEGLDNVTLVDPMPRAALLEEYAAADMLLIHLNDYPAFRKVLPSKLFEYAALERPILAGVAGYARHFLAPVPGCETFAPCDVDGLVAAFETLAAGPARIGRAAFVERYARTRIMEEMARDLLEVARAGKAA